jgi:hypothetical protein
MGAVTEPAIELDIDPDARVKVERGRQSAGAHRRWQCVCGQMYRVSGRDRHRVYWPLEAPPDEPVMDGCCVRCRRPLPSKQAHCAEPT